MMYTADPRDAHFLIWAIGGTSDYTGGISAERIGTLCFDHRVSGRALSRIRRENPKWADQATLDVLTRQQTENRDVVSNQAKALKALRSKYLTANEPLISLKGLGCYALTRNEDHVRRTLDLDLLVAEPERLADALRQDKVKEYRNVSPHEIINAKIGEMGIDLHAHYPVWSVEGGAADWQTMTGDPTGPVVHHGQLKVGQLTYDHLIDEARTADIFGIDGVLTPDPSAAVLIICAHCFRDFLSFSSVTVRTKPTLRFGDIAEIGNYLSDPDFSTERLLALVELTGGHQALRWMAQIIQRFKGDNRLVQMLNDSVLPSQDFFARYPRVVWGGFFACLPDSYENLVTGKVPMSQVYSVLAKETTPQNTYDGIVVRREQLPTTDHTIHVLANPAGAAPVSVSIGRENGAVAVEIDGTVLGQGPNSRVHLEVAGHSWEWNWNRDEDLVTAKRSAYMHEPETKFDKTAAGFRLSLTVDPKDLHPSGQGDIAGLIGVGEFENSPTMKAGTLVPFAIQ